MTTKTETGCKECAVHCDRAETSFWVGLCPLHASAPELLGVLKAIADFSDAVLLQPSNGIGSYRSFIRDRANAARAAIAKAEGR